MYSQSKAKKLLLYVIFIIVFALSVFEILLRLFHIHTSYAEKTGHSYYSYYNQVRPDWFHTWQPNDSFVVDQNDFKFLYKTNSLGVRDREFIFKDSLAHHIICIGDSYTEGFGTSYDSTYPVFLQRDLNAAGITAEVLNAGSAGSDPFYEYTLYRYKLLNTKPGYIILGVNPSDINDYIFRGGFKRFKPDGTTAFNKGPWFEPIYAKSFVARFWINNVCGYINDNLFIKRDQVWPKKREAITQIALAIDSFKIVAVNNNCKLLVILQPDITDCAFNESDDNTKTANLFIGLQQQLEKQNIDVINLWPPLRKVFNRGNYLQYSYQHDTHFNGPGYSILAQTIADEIHKKYPDFWANK